MCEELYRLDLSGIDKLIAALRARRYQIIGPTLQDSAIVFASLESAGELPKNTTTELAPARYRLQPAPHPSHFAYWTGPDSPKKFLHPPSACLSRAEKSNGRFQILQDQPTPPRYAFLGLRPCDLAAIAVQDRVLLQDKFADSIYQTNRSQNFFVALQCASSAPTCFCASLGSGPRARQGFDLALTERVNGSDPVYLVEVGSDSGASLLAELNPEPAPRAWLEEAEAAALQAAREQSRKVEIQSAPAVVNRNFESPRWDQVALRCLACGNCTMVCPTCFCVNAEDRSDLTARSAERWRHWDSCFTQSFSYIHGGSVRLTGKSRYRQWLSHKLAWWQDQFGMPGCVGCGRCIVWCPVGIDITEEFAALAAAPGSVSSPEAPAPAVRI